MMDSSTDHKNGSGGDVVVIDVVAGNNGGGKCDGRKKEKLVEEEEEEEEEEKMCRVCHMGTECLSQCGDFIELGCNCRNDLGTAHRNCAQLWFATKGNSVCEICGAVAGNVSGQQNDDAIYDRNVVLRTLYTHVSSSEHRYQSVCAFVGALIIVSLAIHWLFFKMPSFL